MKYQNVIADRRIVNMKSGITEAQKYISNYSDVLLEKIKNNKVLLTDVDELEEILMLLDWIKNQ